MKNILQKNIGPLILATLALTRFAHAQTTEPTGEPTGDEILAKSAQAYLALSEFRGSSEVVESTSMSIKGGPAQTITEKAGAKFDFKRDVSLDITGLDSQGNAFSIQARANQTILTTNFNGNHQVDRGSDLTTAIATVSSPGKNAATTIPALLLKDGWGFPYVRGNPASLQGREELAGHDCYVVTLPVKLLNQVSTFWIDSQSFLLRQMREKKEEAKPTGAQAPTVQILGSESTHVFTIETGAAP